LDYSSEYGQAMKCAGGLLELCALDPDPEAKNKYQEEFNCTNCDYSDTCIKVWRAVGYDFEEGGNLCQ
jgi:hypothetical protein